MARSDRAVAAASVLMTLNNKQFNRGINETRKSWESFVGRIDNLNKTKFNNSAFGQSVVGGLRNMTGTVSRAVPALTAIGSVIGNVAATAARAGGVIAGGFAGGVGLAVREAAKLEDEALSLKIVMGEAAGGAMADWIRNFYPNTSGSRSVFMQAATDLSRLGMPAEKVQRLLQAMGDAGALSRIGTDAGISKLTDAFRVVEMQGTLTERSLRQFLSVGVNFVDILAAKFGSVEEAQKAIKSGAVDAATAEAYFLEYMTQYYGAMQMYSGTAAGTLGTIRAQLTEIFAGVGSQFLPALKVFGGTVQDFLSYVLSNLPNLAAMVADLINNIIANAPRLLQSGRQILNFLGSVADWLSAIIEGFGFIFSGRIFTREGWREFDQHNQARQERIFGGNWIGSAWQQAVGTTDLSAYLSEHGFAPEQIRSGMSGAAAARAAADLQYSAGRAAFGAGSLAFQNTRVQEEMLTELQGMNEKLGSISGQNAADVNSRIPVRGGVRQ